MSDDTVRTIKDDEFSYKFLCESSHEKYRLRTFFHKEAGTIEWIRSLNKNDVLFDIGANIGIYTLYAAPRVSRVIAFEPHLGNAYRLLQNIDLNEYSNINLISSPVYDKVGLFDFQYKSLKFGEAFNSLMDTKLISVEQKMSVRLDDVVGDGSIPPPTALKLDVDGGEVMILRGMQNILESKTIKSLIVEYNPKEGETIEDNETRQLLEGLGYTFVESQFTTKGKRLINKGRDPNKIEHNFLFRL